MVASTFKLFKVNFRVCILLLICMTMVVTTVSHAAPPDGKGGGNGGGNGGGGNNDDGGDGSFEDTGEIVTQVLIEDHFTNGLTIIGDAINTDGLFQGTGSIGDGDLDGDDIIDGANPYGT